MSKQGYCLNLDLQHYDEIFNLQQTLNKARRTGMIKDTVIILEHTPCFTIGRNGGLNHILVSDEVLEKHGIKVYEIDRGGDITYHGPGQLICYPIIDLKDYERDVHIYASNMEEILIRTLASFGVQAGRKSEYPGVWVGAKKIGAIGIGIRRWVTMHGVSLNVCPNMNHFDLIVPCGIKDYGVTSMEDLLGEKSDIALVKQELRKQFCQVFSIELEDISLEELKVILHDIA